MKIELGSVSTGTLRDCDLIPCFIYVARAAGCKKAWLDEMDARTEVDGYYETEAAGHDLSELFDVLQETCLPYSYFGSLPDDGADFGYWPDWESIEMDLHDKCLIKSDEPPAMEDKPRCLDDVHAWIQVNDHGNTTMYTWDAERRQWSEEWAIV